MFKKLTLLLTILSLGVALTACSKKKSSGGGGGGGGGESDPGTEGGTSSATASCEATEGTRSGVPIYTWTIKKIGKNTSSSLTPSQQGGDWNSFRIGDSAGPGADLNDWTTVQQLFVTDSRMRLRVKVLPQPSQCYDNNGNSLVSHDTTFTPAYDRLKFSISVSQITTNNNNVMQINAPFWEKPDIGPIEADGSSCSSIYTMDLPVVGSIYPYIISIYDVKSNFACDHYNNSQCPADWIIPENGCWSVELQLVTDDTQDFL